VTIIVLEGKVKPPQLGGSGNIILSTRISGHPPGAHVPAKFKGAARDLPPVASPGIGDRVMLETREREAPKTGVNLNNAGNGVVVALSIIVVDAAPAPIIEMPMPAGTVIPEVQVQVPAGISISSPF
jgi:hypothetical protein